MTEPFILAIEATNWMVTAFWYALAKEFGKEKSLSAKVLL